jgi:hypothetical protein
MKNKQRQQRMLNDGACPTTEHTSQAWLTALKPGCSVSSPSGLKESRHTTPRGGAGTSMQEGSAQAGAKQVAAAPAHDMAATTMKCHIGNTSDTEGGA